MNKACPILIKSIEGSKYILCFSHPLAGTQLVKGTIEDGEELHAACERELLEEAGIHASVAGDLGVWDSGYDGQVWGFCLMSPDGVLAETWEFFTEDDGGHLFKFFWHPLSRSLPNAGHPVFEQARAFVEQALTNSCSRRQRAGSAERGR